MTQDTETGFDLAYVAIDEPTKVVRVVSTPFDERGGSLSPDGRWLAYTSAETGRNEVYVTDFPSGSRKWQASRAGGGGASWRADGREIYFLGADGFKTVSVRERVGVFETSAPEPLPFSLEAWDPVTGAGRVYSPDGRRFLVRRYVSEDVPEPLRLVRPWRQVLEHQ